MILPTSAGSDGLAIHHWTRAGPFRRHGYRSTRTPRSARLTPGWDPAEHAEPYTDWRSWRCEENVIGLEGMAQSGSDADQQPLAQQDGQRYQKTIGECRSIYNVGPPDRPRDRHHRLLAVRQLLVAGAGGRRRYGRLTETETDGGVGDGDDFAPCSGDQRRRGVVVRRGGRGGRRGGATVARIGRRESRMQLAPDVRHRLHEPLTPRHV